MIYTEFLGLELLAEGQSQAHVVVNDSFTGFDRAIAGVLSVNLYGQAAIVHITDYDSVHSVLRFMNAQQATTITIQDRTKVWDVLNQTAFPIQFKTLATLGVPLAAGESCHIIFDGSSLVKVAGGSGGGGVGPPGPPGVNGINGINGIDGINGINGTNGADGPPGRDGLAILKFLGKLDSPSQLPTTASMGDAYVINSDFWVYNGAVFVNTGKIQGPPGDTGPQGPSGPQGAAGIDGKDGHDGIDGKDGVVESLAVVDLSPVVEDFYFLNTEESNASILKIKMAARSMWIFVPAAIHQWVIVNETVHNLYFEIMAPAPIAILVRPAEIVRLVSDGVALHQVGSPAGAAGDDADLRTRVPHVIEFIGANWQFIEDLVLNDNFYLEIKGITETSYMTSSVKNGRTWRIYNPTAFELWWETTSGLPGAWVGPNTVSEFCCQGDRMYLLND